jgi:DNA-binding CsgD family transcriptional regulator
MLIADDHRRWVTGNDAAFDLLGIGREEIPWRTMDDATPPSGRRRLSDQWRAFLSNGAAEGWYQLEVPDRGSVPVEFSAIANVVAGRHLMVFATPDDASVAEGQLGSAREAAWVPVAGRGVSQAQLTKRETEVMTMIAAGGHSDDIATQLFLSSETIKSHAQNAMVKLGAHTRAHAVAIALVTGKIMWSSSDSPASTKEPPAAA